VNTGKPVRDGKSARRLDKAPHPGPLTGGERETGRRGALELGSPRPIGERGRG
jgi:hypothetical protein